MSSILNHHCGNNTGASAIRAVFERSNSETLSAHSPLIARPYSLPRRQQQHRLIDDLQTKRKRGDLWEEKASALVTRSSEASAALRSAKGEAFRDKDASILKIKELHHKVSAFLDSQKRSQTCNELTGDNMLPSLGVDKPISYCNTNLMESRSELDTTSFVQEMTRDAPSVENAIKTVSLHQSEVQDADLVSSDDRKAEISPLLYAPPPYRARPDPIVHRFTAINRPVHVRTRVPIDQIYSPPVDGLWKGKFETFNHLQSEIVNTLAYR
jgi:hypothetical protein